MTFLAKFVGLWTIMLIDMYHMVYHEGSGCLEFSHNTTFNEINMTEISNAKHPTTT